MPKALRVCARMRAHYYEHIYYVDVRIARTYVRIIRARLRKIPIRLPISRPCGPFQFVIVQGSGASPHPFQ